MSPSSLDEEGDYIPHKKKKSKRDKHGSIKLILKVGSNSATSTPERLFTSSDSVPSVFIANNDILSTSTLTYDAINRSHKKSKKKKKKKERDHSRHEKKKKHKKDKKKYRTRDSSQDCLQDIQSDIDINENSNLELESNLTTNENNILYIMSDIEKIAFQQLLEYIHSYIVKKDTQKFFAWPVTDQIAPGYSTLIARPMDLSTMAKKIENYLYYSLPQYLEDFELMCQNAMIYNKPDTIYYKAAKKLRYAGRKIADINKLRTIPEIIPLLEKISHDTLCSFINVPMDKSEESENTISSIQANNFESYDDTQNYESKNELEDEDLLAEKILLQAQNAAKLASEKLQNKKMRTQMGYLKQNKDGTTSLNIIVPNDGIDEKTKERPVSLGSFIGKLTSGSNSIAGFKEDKRNFVKSVKPLYYGAFGSYAPSFDSTFSNLTKEESQLLFQTYGDETSVQYAGSILNFSKDSDYMTTMVDNILDIMTSGEHRKTKRILEEKKKSKQDDEIEEKRMKLSPSDAVNNCETPSSNEVSLVNNLTTSEVHSPELKTSTSVDDSKVDIDHLRSLSELGIDTSFLDFFDSQQKEEQKLNDKLEHSRSLLEKLRNTQYERLSSPLPPHLSLVEKASDNEQNLADKVTEGLSNIIKKMPPNNVVSVSGVRKAMGVVVTSQQSEYQKEAIIEESCNTDDMENSFINSPNQSILPPVQISCEAPVSGFDFENELRQFLESDTALNGFQLPDNEDADKTIEQMLSAHES